MCHTRLFSLGTIKWSSVCAPDTDSSYMIYRIHTFLSLYLLLIANMISAQVDRIAIKSDVLKYFLSAPTLAQRTWMGEKLSRANWKRRAARSKVDVQLPEAANKWARGRLWNFSEVFLESLSLAKLAWYFSIFPLSSPRRVLLWLCGCERAEKEIYSFCSPTADAQSRENELWSRHYFDSTLTVCEMRLLWNFYWCLAACWLKWIWLGIHLHRAAVVAGIVGPSWIVCAENRLGKIIIIEAAEFADER